MDTNATYILQWKCPVAEKNADSSGGDQNARPGNAQLLYYYEVLSSESYRGSMTSLQSGFSAMSVASSCQSRWDEDHRPLQPTATTMGSC